MQGLRTGVSFSPLVYATRVLMLRVKGQKVTCSRAREIGRGPRPLRDAANLWGFKNLAEPDAGRVKSANAIYKSAAAFCKHVSRCHPRVGLSIENPTNSWMWQLPGFAELAKQMTVVTFAACRHGSKRDKSTSILTNVTAMEDLAGPCPGGHVHAKWGWQHSICHGGRSSVPAASV